MTQEILIVDDEPRLTKSLKFLFENRGMKVQVSSNGSEAIELFRTSPVKVILTDIQMPKMNGFDLFHNLKKIDPFVQLIFYTGHADMENTKKAFKKQAFEFFKKPVSDIGTLFNAVKSAESRYNQLKNDHEIKQNTEAALSTITKIFDSIEAIIYVSDMETYELLYTNKKFNNELGYQGHENLAGQKCWQVIQKNQTGPCPFCTNPRIIDDNCLPTEPYEWEFHNEKTKKFYRIIDKAIEWVDGRIVRLETAYDITAKKKYEKLFKQHEKTHEALKRLESLGTLAGGIAHQFNNSLSVITGHLDLVDAKFPKNPQLKNHTLVMQDATQKMAQLTTSFLAYARGGKYQAQTFILSKYIRQTIEHLKLGLPPGTKLITDFSGEDHYIKADKPQIQMLLSAILKNALEATNKIGTIKIVCKKEKIEQKDFEQLNIKYEKDYVCLTISDDGPGIDSQTKKRIFEPFFTTKFAGRGLGLSAAYGIIKNHNGYISINSKPKKGTIVKAFLPIITVHKTQKPGCKLHPAKKPLTILLVEDEEAVMRVMKMMLEKMGHRVLGAATGKKAINLVKSYKGSIDLALLDFILPDMNGDIVFPFFVKTHPEMDTIVMSGYAITEPVQKILNGGAKGFIQKPVTMAELSEKIANLSSIGVAGGQTCLSKSPIPGIKNQPA